jgi:acetyl esterase/lipase
MARGHRIGLSVIIAIAVAGLDAASALAQPDPGPRPAVGLAHGGPIERDLSYADTDNPRQRLDLYRPAARDSEQPLPLVVFIHGGGWRGGDRRGIGEARLVGGPVQEHKNVARSASPITYVSRDDPPFLLIHGTADPIVPFSQSERLHDALDGAGVSSTLVPVTGGGHGRFGTPEVAQRVRTFLAKQLLKRKEAVVSDAPIEAGPRERPRSQSVSRP